MAAHGTLDFTSPISGSGSLVLTGAGTFILDAPETFTGAINISNTGATLQIGNATTIGSIADNSIANNGQLSFDRPDDYVYAGPISGTGTIFQNGGGTLELRGDSSGAGSTLIVASTGTLVIDGQGKLVTVHGIRN